MLITNYLTEKKNILHLDQHGSKKLIHKFLKGKLTTITIATISQY